MTLMLMNTGRSLFLKSRTHKQLHALENEIIQTGGLLKALQKLDCNDGAQISVINALEAQFHLLEQGFYKLWEYTVSDSDKP